MCYCVFLNDKHNIVFLHKVPIPTDQNNHTIVTGIKEKKPNSAVEKMHASKTLVILMKESGSLFKKACLNSSNTYTSQNIHGYINMFNNNLL